MFNKIVLAVDGHDYAGKSRFSRKLADLYRSLGMRVVIINQPRNDTVYGKLARQLIAECAPAETTAEALCVDFLDTLDQIPKLEADVVILDRHICSAIVHQGEAGKHAVMQNKRLLRHTSAPDMYIQLTCPYDVMLKRRQERHVTEGTQWDEAQTKQYVETPEAWQKIVDRVEFAHRIVIESGVKGSLEIVPCQGAEQDLKALDIVRQSMGWWIERNQREEARRESYAAV